MRCIRSAFAFCVLSLLILPVVLALSAAPASAQPAARTGAVAPSAVLLRPSHVFDGASGTLHDDWVVLVRGEKSRPRDRPPASTPQPAPARSTCRARRCCPAWSRPTRTCCSTPTTRRAGTIRS